MEHSSVQLAPDVREALERLAQTRREDPEALANAALRVWLREYEETERKVREGIEAVEARQVVTHDRVRAWLATWGTEGEAPRPR